MDNFVQGSRATPQRKVSVGNFRSFSFFRICQDRSEREVLLRELTINAGGLHFNGPMLIPLFSRFNECPIRHIGDNHDRYARRGIRRIHVERIYDIAGIADYSVKTIKWKRADPQHILILPKTANEVRQRAMTADPRARAIKDIQTSLNVSDEMANHLVLNQQ